MDSSKILLALAYLNWSPEHPCLHRAFFPIPQSRRKNQTLAKTGCHVAGVRARVTPTALRLSLAALKSPDCSAQDKVIKVLELIDIARCWRHDQNVPKLEGANGQETVKNTVAVLWDVLAKLEVLDLDDSAGEDKTVLQPVGNEERKDEEAKEETSLKLILRDSSFTKDSFEALVATVEDLEVLLSRTNGGKVQKSKETEDQGHPTQLADQQPAFNRVMRKGDLQPISKQSSEVVQTDIMAMASPSNAASVSHGGMQSAREHAGFQGTASSQQQQKQQVWSTINAQLSSSPGDLAIMRPVDVEEEEDEFGWAFDMKRAAAAPDSDSAPNSAAFPAQTFNTGTGSSAAP